MLEFITSQYIELAKLDEELTAYRARLLRAALNGQGTATRCSDSDAETHSIVARVTGFYRGREWKGKFPPDPENPDVKVHNVLLSSRDLAVKLMADLHTLILEAPVVGCSSEEDPGA